MGLCLKIKNKTNSDCTKLICRVVRGFRKHSLSPQHQLLPLFACLLLPRQLSSARDRVHVVRFARNHIYRLAYLPSSWWPFWSHELVLICFVFWEVRWVEMRQLFTLYPKLIFEVFLPPSWEFPCSNNHQQRHMVVETPVTSRLGGTRGLPCSSAVLWPCVLPNPVWWVWKPDFGRGGNEEVSGMCGGKLVGAVVPTLTEWHKLLQ